MTEKKYKTVVKKMHGKDLKQIPLGKGGIQDMFNTINQLVFFLQHSNLEISWEEKEEIIKVETPTEAQQTGIPDNPREATDTN